MTISTFNRTNLAQLRAEITTALAAVADNNGIDLKLGNMTFAGLTFTVKIEGAVAGESKERVTYRNHAQWEKTLPPLDTKITVGGKEYTINGLKSRGDKVLITRDGKNFLFPLDSLRRMFAPQAKEVQHMDEILGVRVNKGE